MKRPGGTKYAAQGWSQSFLAEVDHAPRALLPRFPYTLIFMDLGETVRVLAVAHAKRRPGYWLDRVGDES